MFCPYCGNQIPDRSKFCTKCGAPLRAPASANTRNTNDLVPLKPGFRLLPLLLVAVSVAAQISLLLVSGFGLSYFTWQQLLNYILLFVMPLLFFFFSKKKTAFPIFRNAAWCVFLFEAVMAVICCILTFRAKQGIFILPVQFYWITLTVPGADLGQLIAYLLLFPHPVYVIQIIAECLIWISTLLICLYSNQLTAGYHPSQMHNHNSGHPFS
jgi:hypothetical protein